MGAAELRRRFAGHRPGLLGARHEFAVLCPLVERPEGLSLLFEVRAATLRRQPGEVCFPGGKMEAGEGPVDCALRETEEELNIPRSTVEVLGMPDFIHNQAGFLLRPVLGIVSGEGLSRMVPSPAEVAQVFTVPLRFFAETRPESYAYDLLPKKPENFPYDEVGISPNYGWAKGRIELPIWHWKGHIIWGMTARITADIAATEHLCD